MRRSIICLSIIFLLFTSACSSLISPQSTATPLPPSDTPTASATPTSSITPSPTAAPDGPCDNPLVPLVSGNIWEYRVTTDTEPKFFTLQVNDRKDSGNITIEVQIVDHKNDRDIKELVICNEGEIVNFPLYLMSMLLVDYLKGILNTYHFHETAPYAPRYGTFLENGWIYSWEPGYLLEENVYLRNPMGGSDLLITYSSPVDLAVYTEGNFEQVEVPAGSFINALEVKVEYTLQATVVDGGTGAGGVLVISTTQWYVPFEGLVKAAIDQAKLDYYDQVYEVNIISELELMDFTIGR